MGATLIVCIAAPGSQTARSLSQILPVPDPWVSTFTRQLSLGWHEKLENKAADYQSAETAIRRALEYDPMSAGAWLNLSYVRLLRQGRWSASASDAFDRSYSVAPISPDVAGWRVHFGLELWPQLSRLEHENIAKEMTAMWRSGPDGRAAAVQTLVGVSDPMGRAAGEVELTGLGWNGQPIAPSQ